MISMSINHPDIEEFIDIKANTDKITNANISVRMDNLFMHAVINKSPNYILSWPVDRFETGICTDNWEYDKLYKVNDVYYKKVDPVKLFNKLVQNNYDYAEPGILYWNEIEQSNMMSNHPIFKYAGINPCGEEPLSDGSACLLGAMNLAEYVHNGQFDFQTFKQDVKTATIGLNEVLQEGIPKHPLKIQQESASNWRAIGLGILDLAGALVKLGITYGSKEAIEFAKKISHEMLINAFMASCDLNTSNIPFDNLFKSDFYKDKILPFLPKSYKNKYPLNSQLLTVAPTGTLSTMLDSLAGGGEPAFALKYTRTTKSLHNEDVIYNVYPKVVKEYIEKHNCTLEELPSYFITSDKVHWKNRINMQAALQENIDASISSTLNLNENVSLEDVKNLYIYAWENHLKGATIFRRNCKRTAILNDSDKPEVSISTKLERGQIIKASEHCIGLKRTLMTGCGSLHCESFFDPKTGDLRECYLSKGSTGGCANFMVGLSRMISLSARGGIKIENILDQLKSCGVCPSYAVRSATKKDTSKGSCCPVAVGNALKDMHEEIKSIICECSGSIEDTSKIDSNLKENSNNAECPNCHELSLTKQGGCFQCLNCGYSRCD